MTRAVPTLSGWAAWYIDRDAGWRLAGNALGRAIICETAALAISVARSRRRRLKPLKDTKCQGSCFRPEWKILAQVWWVASSTRSSRCFGRGNFENVVAFCNQWRN